MHFLHHGDNFHLLRDHIPSAYGDLISTPTQPFNDSGTAPRGSASLLSGASSQIVIQARDSSDL